MHQPYAPQYLELQAYKLDIGHWHCCSLCPWIGVGLRILKIIILFLLNFGANPIASLMPKLLGSLKATRNRVNWSGASAFAISCRAESNMNEAMPLRRCEECTQMRSTPRNLPLKC